VTFLHFFSAFSNPDRSKAPIFLTNQQWCLALNPQTHHKEQRSLWLEVGTGQLLPKINHTFINDPPLEQQKHQIWEYQVLIPYQLAGKTYAFLGPLPNEDDFSDEIKLFFPRRDTWGPRVFDDKTKFDLGFMKQPKRVFRSAPSADSNKPYLEWLDRVKKEKREF
jgi:hypothetical protein